MDDPALALIVEECLALLDAGEDLETVLSRFPDFSATLAPVLRVAIELKESADDAIEVPIEFLKDLGDFLMDQVDDLSD